MLSFSSIICAWRVQCDAQGVTAGGFAHGRGARLLKRSRTRSGAQPAQERAFSWMAIESFNALDAAPASDAGALSGGALAIILRLREPGPPARGSGGGERE